MSEVTIPFIIPTIVFSWAIYMMIKSILNERALEKRKKAYRLSIYMHDIERERLEAENLQKEKLDREKVAEFRRWKKFNPSWQKLEKDIKENEG